MVYDFKQIKIYLKLNNIIILKNLWNEILFRYKKEERKNSEIIY
jgi:hypothetical protein